MVRLVLLVVILGTVFAWTQLKPAWESAKLRQMYLPELAAAAEKSPYDGRLLALFGVRLMQAGQYSVASGAFQHAIAAGENGEDVWLNLAAANALSGEPGKAKGDLSLAIRMFPTSPGLQSAQVRVRLLGATHDNQALARSICPDGTSALEQKLELGGKLNDVSVWLDSKHPEGSGFASREQWARQQPSDGNIQRLWGLALLKNQRYGEAIDVLRHSVEIAPESAPAILALAQAYEQSGLAPKALLQYVACLKIRRDWKPALLGIGRSALAADATRYAIAAFKRCTEVDPNDVEGWIGLGRAGFALPTHHAESLNAFQTAARLAPTRTDFLDDYAVALREAAIQDPSMRNGFALAEAVLRRRIASDPEDWRARYLLGNVILKGEVTPGRLSEAEMQTRQALALFPNQPLVEMQLGRILLNRGDAKGAVDMLSQAALDDPMNAQTAALLAQAYERSGNHALAQAASKKAKALGDTADKIAKLELAAKNDRWNASIHEQLLSLYQQAGQLRNAAVERSFLDIIRKGSTAASKQSDEWKSSIDSVLPLEQPISKRN